MALAIDASTPAIATQATSTVATVTSASFTPPAGSTLLVMYSANTVDPTSPATPTITDSLGAHLTYTLSDFSARADTPAADGQAAIWTAPIASSAAMTITVTNQAPSGSRHASLDIIVITGANPTPVGAHGKSGSISAGSIAQSYTAQATSGWGFLAVIDWAATGPMSAGAGCTLIGSANLGAPDITYGFFRRTSADDSNGVSNTLNATLGGTSTSVRWAYAEIVPAAAGSSGTAPLIVSRPAVPAPIPPVLLSASRPLGNPAVPTPQPLVVSTPWSAKAPGAILTSSAALPAVTSIATPNALVVTPAYRPVSIPGAQITASQPLGNPAAASPQPLVVGPPPAVAGPAGALITRAPSATVTVGNIAFDTTGSTSMTAAATSTNVDITAAAVGAWCYCWVALGVNSGAVTATGWTSLLDADEGTAAHYALLRRQKQAGDTTFSFGWTTSTKGTLAWASWTGLDGATPDEGAALATNGLTSRTAVPTPTATPTAANRWAAGFFANRTTNVANKPISWTPDAAQAERSDVDNNAAGSAPWVGVEIADTNSAVTQAAHSYTATHAPAAESHDGSAILFLIPGAATSSAASPQPIVVGPPWAAVPIPGAQVSASQPLGNPAVGSPQPLVVTPTYVRPPVPGALLFGIAGVAVTPQPLVVSPGFKAPAVPGAIITSNPAAPVVSGAASPQPLVVTPPFTPVPTPPVSITASQPLGTPAVPTPQPVVVTAPWAAPVPGAKLYGPGAPLPPVSTVSTPGPLVVTPPFQPVPIPLTYLSASQPLGNPAAASPQPLVVTGQPATPLPRAFLAAGAATTASAQPLVVTPAFTLAPVPGARVFAAPTATTPAVATPGPLVVTPPWLPVAIPKTYLSASFPLGNPAVRSPQPLVVTPAHRWTPATLALASRTMPDHFCPPPTVRPSTGTTTRPAGGTTTYATATTARPSTGTTARPNTGTTTEC